VSTAGINAIHHTIPSLAIKATKYTGITISNYFRKSATTKKEIVTRRQKTEKSSHNRKVLPISIGVSEGARLVSSTGR